MLFFVNVRVHEHGILSKHELSRRVGCFFHGERQAPHIEIAELSAAGKGFGQARNEAEGSFAAVFAYEAVIIGIFDERFSRAKRVFEDAN